MPIPLESPKPWYRQFHVWLVIAFPALSVVAGLASVWIAVATDDGLVVDDYYKQGLEINQVLDRDRAAAALGLRALVQRDDAHGLLRVSLESTRPFPAPPQLKVSYLHRTRSGFDRVVLLEPVGAGIYEGPEPELARGDWDVLIEAGNWRLLQTFSVRG